MHEASIVQSLLQQVAEMAHRHGAIGVHRVFVRLGTLSGVEPELLVRAYEALRARTLCESAPLEVGTIVARWECPRCGRALEPGAILTCPDCLRPARLAQGDEIVLERLELEVS